MIDTTAVTTLVLTCTQSVASASNSTRATLFEPEPDEIEIPELPPMRLVERRRKGRDADGIVQTEDGRVLFKRLLRGSGPELYDLESIVGPTLSDVRLRWAAHYTAIIPPFQAAQTIRRAGERQVA